MIFLNETIYISRRNRYLVFNILHDVDSHQPHYGRCGIKFSMMPFIMLRVEIDINNTAGTQRSNDVAVTSKCNDRSVLTDTNFFFGYVRVS